jgi:Mrp family chromosome partitioning ATPase
MSEDDLEGFRVLRTNVEFLDVDHPPKVILVTSSLPEEGKSTVSAALAATYAIAGKRTLIVEGDLRRPTLAARTGIKPAPGLSDYLVGRAQPAEVLQSIAPAGGPANGDRPADAAAAVPYVVITAGSPAPQPAELLRSQRCRDFFAQVREAYDIVIVDTCPLLSVADTLELLPVADAVVLCVRASKTTRDQAKAAKNAMAHFPDRPTGVVLTGVRARDDASYHGYYSYGYVYGSTGR